MKKYVLNGASQTASQWDGSNYIIQPKEIVTQVTCRRIRDNLYRIKSDGRVVQIPESIIERYFTEIGGD